MNVSSFWGKVALKRGDSARCDKKFVVVNLGMTDENFLNSELFGHVKGAFTGASSNRTGSFVEAGGTNKGRQRYKCKTCQYFLQLSVNPTRRRQISAAWPWPCTLEGLGLSRIAIYKWVRAFGENLEQIKRPAAHIVELDEFHSYVRHKKTTVGPGLLLIDLGNAFSMLSLAPEEP